VNSQLFTDDFNRANSNTIGTGWSQTVATAGSVQIISNAYFQQGGTSAPRDGFVLRTETFNNNQYMKAKFLTYSDNDGSNLASNGICVRGSGTLTSFTGYALFPANSGGSGARLVKLVNSNLNTGPPTNITNLQTGLTVTANDILELRANGTSITCLKNGAAFASATDSAIASGKAGFVNPFITNFTTNQAHTTTWDDASGGDILPDVVDVTVNVTGVAATGSPGSITVQTSANPVPTGVAATGAAGSPTITGSSTLTLTGVAGTGAAGSLSINASVSVTLTGIGAVSSPGFLIEEGDAMIALIGQAGIASPGDLQVEQDVEVDLEGIEAASAAGDLDVFSDIDVDLEGVAAVSFAGDVVAGPKYTRPLHASGHVLLEFSASGEVVPECGASGEVIPESGGSGSVH
jgi:hypothetical protein